MVTYNLVQTDNLAVTEFLLGSWLRFDNLPGDLEF